MHKARLRPEIFNLPVEKMRDGYYSDTYFNRARQIMERAALEALAAKA